MEECGIGELVLGIVEDFDVVELRKEPSGFGVVGWRYRSERTKNIVGKVTAGYQFERFDCR